MIVICVSQNPISSPDALTAFERCVNGAGAIVSFTGRVRSQSPSSNVIALHLQAYPPMTEKGIRRAVSFAKENWLLCRTHVIHRIGDIKTGETIVFVATASPHRRAAFQAADFLMDYLKTEAVFWKKEITTSGSQWIEPRPEDYRDHERWEQLSGAQCHARRR
jgi:molybdopterin synthase catalytic subunit